MVAAPKAKAAPTSRRREGRALLAMSRAPASAPTPMAEDRVP